jgi:hypothetical protein
LNLPALIACLLLCLTTFTSSSNAQTVATSSTVPSPADHLGRPVGTDFRLADWTEVSEYYAKLDAASDRVLVEKIGQTTEGRDFLLSIISSEENMAQLDALRAYAHQISHPNQYTPAEISNAVSKGKIIAFITLSMHSTETASTEMGMQFAYQLATSNEEPWPTIRQEVVVVIVPSLNPDGIDHVVRWYRQHVGTPYEGADLTRLYQYYTGHDNNRDWFSLTQAETRLLTQQLYQRWYPQVLWDVHEYGSGTQERLFLPPYRDPLNPNIDPAIVAGINFLGTRGTADLTRSQLRGVAQGIGYDAWWNGGNRSVPCRHNIMGILTEAASVNIASPIFVPLKNLKDPLKRKDYQRSVQFIDPWEGGWWRLSDIIRYETAFGTSLLSSLARERSYWLTNSLDVAKRAVALPPGTSPVAWIIPSNETNKGSVERLVDILLASGIEIDRADSVITADGRQYPAGSLIIRRAQAYGNYAKDLLEVQSFPSDVKPYDVTGWTLPPLFDVRCIEVASKLECDLSPVTTTSKAMTSFVGDPRLTRAPSGSLNMSDSGSWKQLFTSLKAGQQYLVPLDQPAVGLLLTTAASDQPRYNGQSTKLTGMPRVGLYSPWSASMDEGWLRWLLDSTSIPFQTLKNETIKAGRLRDIVDVIIIPDLSDATLNHGRDPGTLPGNLAGGLENIGVEALEEFVLQGGTLIGTQGSAEWLRTTFELPFTEVTADDKEFLCPGSVVRAEPTSSLLTKDMPASTSIFFSSSKAWTHDTKNSTNKRVGAITTHLNYAPRNVLVSGYIQHPGTIEGSAAWVEAKYGDGQIHLFGFRPHYRGWTQGTFHLLFRAMLLNQPATK